MKKKCPGNERNNPGTVDLSQPISGSDSDTSQLKKINNKSSIVKAAKNPKKIEAIQEEDEGDN